MTVLAVAFLVAGVFVWPWPVPDRPDGTARHRLGSQLDGGRWSRGDGAAGRPWRVGPLARVRRRRSEDDWVADLAEVTAVGLRAGLDLPRAALVGSRSPAVARAAPWLESRLVSPGGDGVAASLLSGPPSVTGEQAADLGVLARAWRLSEETGAAASATTAAAAASVRSRAAARERAAAALAGPRASMRLLTALPLGGPFVGLLLGLDPATLYGSAPARVAAAAGLGLTGFGWWWAAATIARARRPGRTGAGS